MYRLNGLPWWLRRKKHLPTMWETDSSLRSEDPSEKEMAPHSLHFCLESPMDGGSWVGYSPWGQQRV